MIEIKTYSSREYLRLKDENDRLQKELDKAYQRPPAYNPIHMACGLGANKTPEAIGIDVVEMAVYKNRPAYIFSVTEMNRDASKVIALLEFERFEFVRLGHEDLARPFPQEQAEGLTVCVGIPADGPGENYLREALGRDSDTLTDWEKLYSLSVRISRECFPKYTARWAEGKYELP